MKMNPVVHFEMPAEDRKRMMNFYAKTFGWEINEMGEDMRNYMVVMTGKSDKNGPLEKNMINGGFFPKIDDMPAQDPSVCISVDDINEAMKKISGAGGGVLRKPWDIPGVGIDVSFMAKEGNPA